MPRPTGWSHESTNSNIEWYTPQWLFAALPIDFDLDPCAAPGTYRTPARHHLTLEEDGLKTPWTGRGSVWLNPPYGRFIPQWLAKLKVHGDGVALVFCRTDTEWFHTYAPDAVLFLRGRLRFISSDTLEPGGTPGAPSMLMAYGDKAVQALRDAALPGALYVFSHRTCGATHTVHGGTHTSPELTC
ncbi:DNA N-6-adenine-methyltransferase [Deinococcus kurensis]|uniref:DNA N-6-adenine-methyltransferase n=1 Tax=Deinococcus kurensis TaxID=2662757 RepID=UPI0012D2C2B1|nr:DNA N-6-adenine-methyltransferase [Deinococcus kurensis]